MKRVKFISIRAGVCLTLVLMIAAVVFILCFIFYFQSETELVEAAYNADFVKIQELINTGSDINAKGMDDWTALTIASCKGNLKVVEFLLKHDANINQLEGGGNSALFWAVFYGHLDVIKLLLQHGADPNKKGAKNKLPIEIAREKGFNQIAALLASSQKAQ